MSHGAVGRPRKGKEGPVGCPFFKIDLCWLLGEMTPKHSHTLFFPSPFFLSSSAVLGKVLVTESVGAWIRAPSAFQRS